MNARRMAEIEDGAELTAGETVMLALNALGLVLWLAWIASLCGSVAGR